MYNMGRSQHSNLDKEIVKIIFIRGMWDDCLNLVNIFGKGDISKDPYDVIVKYDQRSSKGSIRNRTMTHDTSNIIIKSTNNGET